MSHNIHSSRYSDLPDLPLKPPTWMYKKKCKLIHFSYSLRNPTFQQGYHGIQPSFIIGTLHLKFPNRKPLKARKIEIYFKGSMSKANKKLFESTRNELDGEITELNLTFEFKIPKDSPSTVIPINSLKAQGEISYSIRAVITQRPLKFLNMEKPRCKMVEVRCPITRWSLPITATASRNNYESLNDTSPVMFTKSNKQVEGQITFGQSTFRNESLVMVPLKLVFHHSNTHIRSFASGRPHIKKICMQLKEYQRLKVKARYYMEKRSLISSEFPPSKLSSIPDAPDEFHMELKLDTSLADCKYPINSAAQTEMVDVWHKLKIKVCMNNAKDLTFEKKITLVNAICEEEAKRIVFGWPSLDPEWRYEDLTLE
ncbi:14091_t:CDS:2 [Acaulospora morrowiae]|uniref:14091_t:CDS:1 n=1 Tax=Acaulospora morrowiae TaxID=94023 RepID=A0A9N9CTI9_9GLOM|nr:14091_t:CDS:2 [Acaulospora morrowiae]